jgi:DNA-binding response OmpR family regulator
MRIGLVHADPAAQVGLARMLADLGHEVSAFESGLAIEQAVGQGALDLLVMRWDGVELSGVALLHRLRAGRSLPPGGAQPAIILLVDAGTPGSIAEAADAVLAEPVAAPQLAETLATVAARHRQHVRATPKLGALMFDDAAGQVLVHGIPVQLTAKEYALAQYLMRNIGRPLARDEIMSSVWGHRKGNGSRTLDAHIAQVRKRLLLQPEHGWRLSSVYGFGYRLDRVEPATTA